MSLTIQQFESLCDYNEEKHIFESKCGEAYIQALSKVFNLINKNDKPFTITDIKQQPTLKQFSFSGVKDYTYICKLRAKPLYIINGKRKNEKIEAIEFENEKCKEIFNKAKGVSYLITCTIENDEHIIKIGQTRTPFKNRLGSYNCGTVNNWRTASTTNIKILQSLVTTRLPFNLYIYNCSEDQYFTVWHNIKSINFASPKSLAVEDIMIKKFVEQFHQKPLANIQANATED